MISWECVRIGIKTANLERGVRMEPTQDEIGDTVISIIKSMSKLAVEVNFEDVLEKCVRHPVASKYGAHKNGRIKPN